MDDAAIFDLARGSALRGLARATHVIDLIGGRGDASRLLGTALAKGQFDCAGQVRSTTIFALRCVMPVVGRPWALCNWDDNVLALRAQVKGAARDVAGLSADDFTGAAARIVMHKAGDAVLKQRSEDYLIQFAIPNMWFHLSMAYAVLRQAEIPLGKADFDGLHAYPADFSFS